MSRVGGATAVFLQARLDSSRLPAKALYELAGKPIVSHCMAALRALPAERYCLLTDQASAAALAPFAASEGFELFAGPKDDVLARFVLAADHFGVEHIWRGTADNPLVSLTLSALIRDAYLAQGADHAVMRGVPHGSCIEAVSAKALRRVQAESADPYEHEHVCPGVYRHPERYRALQLDPPAALARPELSVTVDTMADYQRMKALFDACWRGRPIALDEAIAWLDRSQAGASGGGGA